MKQYPKISVITPSYNQGEFLEDTIQSILGQNYPNLEYIICDGGSTDNSRQIIEKYQDRITWWCSEKDKGQTDAINKGMHKATGEIVGWINSDDVLFPGALFKIAEHYMQHPETDFLNGSIADLDRKGNFIKFTQPIMSKYFMKRGCATICQQGMFWKRNIFDKIGYLNPDFHARMDVEWLIRVYEGGYNVKLLKLPIGGIRVYGETKTALGGAIWDNDAKAIISIYGGKYKVGRKGLHKWAFYVTKLFYGCYLNNFLYSKKWSGKHYSAFRYK